MQAFAQQIVSGLATGGIYASLALALVLIYNSMELVNFAQGELAMFTTFIAWALIQAGMTYWLAFASAVVVAFAIGVALERVVIRPVERAPVLSKVMITLGLLISINGLAGAIWGYVPKPFPSPFPTRPITFQGVALGIQDLGIIGVSLLVLILIFGFLRYTKAGLALRCAALYPESSQLLGVRISWMLALGWGLAAAVGAVSGLMVAPVVFLAPSMMQGVILFAFAAAVLGGIESPLGAVVGGLLVGVLLNLVGAYIPRIGGELRLAIGLVLIVGVLVVRPSGLFGHPVVRRV